MTSTAARFPVSSFPSPSAEPRGTCWRIRALLTLTTGQHSQRTDGHEAQTLHLCHLERSRSFAMRMARGVERPLPVRTRMNLARCGGPFMNTPLPTGEPMKTPLQSRSSLVALAGAFAATLFLVACQQSQPPAPTPISAESKAATTAKDVFVVFEGPWAIVPDPKDVNAVLLLSPKTRAHRDLYVTASNNSTLAPGTYDLSVPGRTGSAAGTFDESILRAKIDPKNVQRVLDDKSANRYAIRLPKPDAYLPASRHRSRVSATYPPEPATEKEYATVVSLRYSVSSLSGFSLAGAPASGAFNPLLLQVETPTIRFVIDLAHEPDPADKCNTHSRQSFH